MKPVELSGSKEGIFKRKLMSLKEEEQKYGDRSMDRPILN
jgi:hypothetical protein